MNWILVTYKGQVGWFRENESDKITEWKKSIDES